MLIKKKIDRFHKNIFNFQAASLWEYVHLVLNENLSHVVSKMVCNIARFGVLRDVVVSSGCDWDEVKLMSGLNASSVIIESKKRLTQSLK